MTNDEWLALQNTLAMVYSPLIFAWVVLLITSAWGVIAVVVSAYILKGSKF